MIIEEAFYQYAQQTPQKMAFAVEQESLSYGEVWELVCGLAYYLKFEKKVAKGEHVLIRGSQSLEFVITYFAVHLCGAVAVLLERDLPNEEFVKKAILCGASVAFSAADEQAEQLEQLFVKRKSAKQKENLDIIPLQSIKVLGMQYKNDWHPEQEGFPQEQDIADVLFTTGTTGKSKGVILSHGNLKATAENIMTACELKTKDCIIVVGPLNHANPIRKIYTAVGNHSSAIILDGLKSIRSFYTVLEKYKANAACLPPSAVAVLLKLSGNKLSEYSEQLEFIETSTAPMPESLKQELYRLLPQTRLYNSYGSSEAGVILTYDYSKYKGKLNCLGRPSIHAELFLADENHQRIPDADSSDLQERQPHFLACRSAVNMQGYLGDPELTAHTLIDGCVYTSDLVYIGEDGFYYSAGRGGDVINIGGLKVAPVEVEELIELCPEVDECMLIPIKDELTGHRLKLLIVGNTNYEQEKLISYMRKHLEDYKIPRLIEEVSSIPKTYNGKKDRKPFYI